MKCPFCQTELLGQEDYPLERCDQCNLWYELKNREPLPLRDEPLYHRRRVAAYLEIDSQSTDCFECHKPLMWISRSKRLLQGRDVDELTFRCDSCKHEFRFRNGRVKELKIERDQVAEQMAMHKAEMETVRNRRCSHCGGPLDDFLTCGWCHESYSVDNGELVPRSEEPLRPKPKLSDFYAPQQ